METAEVMAIIGGHVDKELLKRNEYLAAENEILLSKIKGHIKFTDDERSRLAKLGKELGRKALADIGPIVKPETIIAWYRKLIAEKFDSSKSPRKAGRPKKEKELEILVVRIAQENDTWGYDRIAGAVTNLGYEICDEIVGNILRRRGIRPVRGRHRGMPWFEFIEQQQDVLVGCDFFTAEVFTPMGLITYYVSVLHQNWHTRSPYRRYYTEPR